MKRGMFFVIVVFCVYFSLYADAKDRECHARRGRPQRHGNERSERPSELRVGRAQQNGNGCPAGMMSLAFAPDNLSFSILYDQFIAQTGVSIPKINRTMECDLLVPVSIPLGMQMEITQVAFRGFASIPDRARARLHSIFNFRGPGGDKDRLNLFYDFSGPMMEDYEVASDDPSDIHQPAGTEVSPCGGDVKLRIFTRLVLNANDLKEDATITLDSVDGAAQATYYVNWRKCR